MQADGKRGRPREADPQRIARVALNLFERQGFESVTMDQIAEAAGVSRSTLFRLYPSKSDLVWEGLRGIVEVVRESAAAISPRKGSIAALVEDVLYPILRTLDEPAAAKLARRRLRLIAASPALLNHQLLAELQAVLTSAVAGLRLQPVSSAPTAPPSLTARTLVSIAFGAVLWWADSDDAMTAVDAVRAAFAAAARAKKR